MVQPVMYEERHARVLSDPQREAVYDQLTEENWKTVTDVAEEMVFGAAITFRILGELTNAGLVETENKMNNGQWVTHYRRSKNISSINS